VQSHRASHFSHRGAGAGLPARKQVLNNNIDVNINTTNNQPSTPAIAILHPDKVIPSTKNVSYPVLLFLKKGVEFHTVYSGWAALIPRCHDHGRNMTPFLHLMLFLAQYI